MPAMSSPSVVYLDDPSIIWAWVIAQGVGARTAGLVNSIILAFDCRKSGFRTKLAGWIVLGPKPTDPPETAE